MVLVLVKNKFSSGSSGVLDMQNLLACQVNWPVFTVFNTNAECNGHLQYQNNYTMCICLL